MELVLKHILTIVINLVVFLMVLVYHAMMNHLIVVLIKMWMMFVVRAAVRVVRVQKMKQQQVVRQEMV
jgi:hypothetical protein